MGLLDGILGTSMDDPRTMATLQLAQGLLGGRSTMQGLTSGMQGYGGVMAQARAQKLAEEEARQKMALQQAQMEEVQAQAQQRQAAMRQAQAQAQAQAEHDQRFRAALGQGMVSPAAAASMPGGPTQGNAAQIGAGQPTDWAALARQFPDQIETIKKLSEAQNFGRSKVARTVKGMGPDGKEYEYQVDEFGQRVGDGMAQYRAPIQVDQGNRKTFADPYSLKPMGSFQTYQDPNSAASTALGYSRLAFDKSKDARDQGAGQLVESQNGYVRVGKDNSATPIMLGGAPLMGKGANMTEDQGKATGWLVQAENAWKNMQANTAGQKPGAADAVAGLPMMGAVGNTLRSASRQKFVQASESLSEALLRAATGAGVNKDEAAQKARELTPQWGEDASTTAQKNAAIPLYIESLKVRAGPGAAKAASVGANARSAPAGGATLQDLLHKYGN